MPTFACHNPQPSFLRTNSEKPIPRMKKQRYQIGKAMAAAVLIAASWRASGQSADAIVNKLVQKGVLTQQEADDLRKEADKDFAKSFAARSGMPAWTKNVTFSGDF